jgi:phage repressor protein C with HTH and peptisase S24 domain
MVLGAREILERLCVERGEDFAGLSRLIGRNSAYIQQFVRRGVPRKLSESDRRKLARYFSVPESMLGGPGGDYDPAQSSLVPVMQSAVRASAGPGVIPDGESARPWLRRLTSASPGQLSVIRVEGDSMAPTLADGDDILIDRNDSNERLRDGVYVLRVDEALVVKRLALHPIARRVTVQSDNPAYSDWPDCELKDVHCIGRVIWAGRKVA